MTDDPFHGYQGNDLLNWAIARPSVYRVKKECCVRDAEEMIAENMVNYLSLDIAKFEVKHLTIFCVRGIQ